MAHSQRGSLVYISNRTKILPTSQFKLQFNAAELIKLKKDKIEIRHSLNASKRKLNINQERPLSWTHFILKILIFRPAVLKFDSVH